MIQQKFNVISKALAWAFLLQGAVQVLRYVSNVVENVERLVLLQIGSFLQEPIRLHLFLKRLRPDRHSSGRPSP